MASEKPRRQQRKRPAALHAAMLASNDPSLAAALADEEDAVTSLVPSGGGLLGASSVSPCHPLYALPPGGAALSLVGVSAQAIVRFISLISQLGVVGVSA